MVFGVCPGHDDEEFGRNAEGVGTWEEAAWVQGARAAFLAGALRRGRREGPWAAQISATGPDLFSTGQASDVNRRRPSLLCLGSSRGGAVARSRGRAHWKAEGTGKEGPSGGLAGSGKPRDLASGEPWRAHWRDKWVGIANEKMVGLRTDLIPSMRVNSRWSPEPNAKL